MVPSSAISVLACSFGFAALQPSLFWASICIPAIFDEGLPVQSILPASSSRNVALMFATFAVCIVVEGGFDGRTWLPTVSSKFGALSWCLVSSGWTTEAVPQMGVGLLMFGVRIRNPDA